MVSQSVTGFLFHGHGRLVEGNRVEHVLRRGVRALRDRLRDPTLVQVMAYLGRSRWARNIARLHLLS